jgi:uncharacterized DUF497 family protein
VPTSILAEFEWDSAKAAVNLEKHGVSFERVLDLEWNRAVTTEDRRFQYRERRFVAYAPIGQRLYAVVYSPRGTRRRIISLRRANSREIVRYRNAQED